MLNVNHNYVSEKNRPGWYPPPKHASYTRRYIGRRTAKKVCTVWQPPTSGDFDVPLWTKTGTEVQTYVTDGNKNTRQLKNAIGTVIANHDYELFGLVTTTGTATPWQFSSEYRDAETGLVYYNYRYYAPKLGRWTKRDFIEISEEENHLYSFVNNSATMKVDHLGLYEYTYTCCNSSEQDTIKTAARKASNLSKNAKGWIYPPPSDKKNKVTFRYQKFFGKYQKERTKFVETIYKKIINVLDGKINFDCSLSGCSPSYYAYVITNDGKYKIYICTHFWAAPTSGRDSKAGSILHELAHEVDSQIGDKQEAGRGAYGMDDVLFYATHYPWTAVTNAQNYEYFAESFD